MKKIRYILATILIILFMNLLPLTKVSAAEEANETQSVLDIKRNEAANVNLRAGRYAIGTSVTVNGESFYVIGVGTDTYTLLAKSTIGHGTIDDAKSQASSYGSSVGGTGRLLTKEEAEALYSRVRNIGTPYWTETEADPRLVHLANGVGVSSAYWRS